MSMLVVACEEAEGGKVDAEDLANFNLMLADCSCVVQSAIEDLQPLIDNLLRGKHEQL